ncbi:hypothetical protein [Nonomuraea jabiensis]|uniref:Uncharacterized protein n=1 Tax=Nonomuraea jabiensis TaxID=882448 RepID=A0A7W9L962_9ACTN|nr:hypothetical protein [Nonomuraea jabiensis]MBB5775153.1 hypothetical protein [Nonomuraea jabiensis]
MMAHTERSYAEDELRAALTEHVERAHADLPEIMRRGRRIRRRRVAAGAALAGTAVILLALPLGVGAWSASHQKESAAVVLTPTPDPSGPVPSGRVPVIKSHSSSDLGRTTVDFQPLSTYTSWQIFCKDPKALVVIQAPGGGSRVSGRCDKTGLGGSFGGSTAIGPGWLEKAQQLDVFVFPATPPKVADKGPDAKWGCKKARLDLGLCDGHYVVPQLAHSGVADRLAALVEGRSAGWTIELYDRQGMTAPFVPPPNYRPGKSGGS